MTSRSLRGDWAPAPELTVVRVCENPAVAEAATEQTWHHLLALPGTTEWLPDADGLYEEVRLQPMIADLSSAG